MATVATLVIVMVIAGQTRLTDMADPRSNEDTTRQLIETTAVQSKSCQVI